MPVTPKVARHLRSSMVGQLGAGLASFGFHLQPQLYRPADQIKLRCLAIFLNGSLSVFALRRTAKVVRFRASGIVSTLFAFRTSARSFLSCSGVQGARGVPFISPSPAAPVRPAGGFLRSDSARRPPERPTHALFPPVCQTPGLP